MPPKFLPSVPWNLGRKVPETFRAILVVFWGSSWLPKLASGFPGVVPTRIYYWGSDPTEACGTHLAGYPPKLPPVMEEYCSLLQCSMLGTGGTCVIDFFFEEFKPSSLGHAGPRDTLGLPKSHTEYHGTDRKQEKSDPAAMTLGPSQQLQVCCFGE